MKLSKGVEPTGRSQPVATKSLIARNRSHTRKRAPVGALFASALAAEPRPRQHLTLQQFLAPLTARRCPLLGTYRQTTLASPGAGDGAGGAGDRREVSPTLKVSNHDGQTASALCRG